MQMQQLFSPIRDNSDVGISWSRSYTQYAAVNKYGVKHDKS